MLPPPPPRYRRRLPLVLDTHPFEFALGTALVVLGLRGLTGAPSPSVAALPVVPLAMYLVVSTLGGIGLLIGLTLIDPADHIGVGKAIERASLFLVAASYGGLAFLLVVANGSAGIATATVSLVIAAACLRRASAIRKASRIILEQLRALNRDDGGRP